MVILEALKQFKTPTDLAVFFYKNNPLEWWASIRALKTVIFALNVVVHTFINVKMVDIAVKTVKTILQLLLILFLLLLKLAYLTGLLLCGT